MMKKLIAVVAFFAIGLSASAQVKLTDKVDSDGFRHISAPLEICRNTTDKAVFAFALSAFQKDSQVIKVIEVKVTSMNQYEVKKGMKFLFKDMNDQVYTLESRRDASALVRDVHNVNGYVFSDYSTIATYEVTEDVLVALSSGVKKVRMESTAENFEKEYKKDKVGKVFAEQNAAINEALAQKKSFDSGF